MGWHWVQNAFYTDDCFKGINLRFLLYVTSSVEETPLCNADSPINSFCTDEAKNVINSPIFLFWWYCIRKEFKCCADAISEEGMKTVP